MGERIKKLKKIRIHREGTNELTLSALVVIGIATVLWYSFNTTIPFWIFIIIFGTAWLMALVRYVIITVTLRRWSLPLPTAGSL